MKRVLSIMCLLLSSCSSSSTETEKWVVSNTANDAELHFSKIGYTTYVLEDKQGSTYSGERKNNNVKCKFNNLDINIKVFKVGSSADVRLRDYVTMFNQEMERLRSVRDSCEDAKK
ncbi:MAG: hypothetical protein G8D90_11930 [gamma proteobacterium symbiont of Clathrolucina costata]